MSNGKSQGKYGSLFRLDGKRALVTGGAGILGRHFCAGLAEFGASVAVVDVNGDAAQQLAQKLHAEFGVKAVGIQTDVSSPESVREMVATTARELGGIDILLNNAATKSNDLNTLFKPFEEYPLAHWREISAVNLEGIFLVAQAVGKQMIAQGTGGSIVQTSSIYGLMGPDQRIYEGSEYMGRPINTPAVYSATKAGIDGLTRYLATYWAHHNIRVNTLVPGGVESGQNEEFKRRYSARVPLGRMAKDEEMVGQVLFLASGASSYVTGQTLFVDGGLSAW